MEEHSYAISSVHEEVNNSSPGGGSDSVSGGSGEYPGWLHEVKLGATTVWERWNSLDESGHVSSTGMNSLNHYSYGAILEWIFRHAAGMM